jgi:hypothetical protein
MILPKSMVIAAIALALSLSLVVFRAGHAEQKKDSGPTQAQIDCKNRAVNDYYDQLKECDKALGDLPADNAQCHSDARSDLDRTQSDCMAALTTGGLKGIKGVLGTGAQTLDTGKSDGTSTGQQLLHETPQDLQLHVLQPAPQPQQPQLKLLQPTAFTQSVPIACKLRGSQLIYAENSTEQTFPKGARIGWQTDGGQQGAIVLSLALGPKGRVALANVQKSGSCTAWAVPLVPAASE